MISARILFYIGFSKKILNGSNLGHFKLVFFYLFIFFSLISVKWFKNTRLNGFRLLWFFLMKRATVLLKIVIRKKSKYLYYIIFIHISWYFTHEKNAHSDCSYFYQLFYRTSHKYISSKKNRKYTPIFHYRMWFLIKSWIDNNFFFLKPHYEAAY